MRSAEYVRGTRELENLLFVHRGSLRGWFLVFFFFPLSFFTSRPERLRFRDLRFVGGRRRGFPGTGSATLYRPHRRNLSITIAVCCRRSTVTPRHGDQFTERPLGPTSFTSLPSSPRIIHVPCKHMYVYIYIYMSAVRACLYRSNLPSSSRNAL